MKDIVSRCAASRLVAGLGGGLTALSLLALLLPGCAGRQPSGYYWTSSKSDVERQGVRVHAHLLFGSMHWNAEPDPCSRCGSAATGPALEIGWMLNPRLALQFIDAHILVANATSRQDGSAIDPDDQPAVRTLVFAPSLRYWWSRRISTKAGIGLYKVDYVAGNNSEGTTLFGGVAVAGSVGYELLFVGAWPSVDAELQLVTGLPNGSGEFSIAVALGIGVGIN
ncbi:MAG: hypothetical protein MJE77_27155 [Proteobacteria bacterium]|nr:hypothetical protein [Pseudomonadota bacterium]